MKHRVVKLLRNGLGARLTPSRKRPRLNPSVGCCVFAWIGAKRDIANSLDRAGRRAIASDRAQARPDWQLGELGASFLRPMSQGLNAT